MPVLKVYHHGMTAGVPPRALDHLRAKRGAVGGWSSVSIRSNTRFLYSVDERGLSGSGWALSLTLRWCPPSHEDWQRLRRAFVKRLERMGLIRAHWLTEWQRRGVPHLHAAVWLPPPASTLLVQQAELVHAWLQVAAPYGAGPRGQHVEPIHDAIGWFKYLAKHASRGLHHYQRSPDSIPEGWQRTGRMWGYLGEWPTREAIRLNLSMRAYHAFRRVVRAYRLADARQAYRLSRTDQAAKQARRRITQARRMLTCHEPKLSAVRGVSEWMEVELQLQIVHWLALSGHEVQGE